MIGSKVRLEDPLANAFIQMNQSKPGKRWPLWGMVALILVIYAFLTPVLFDHRAWPFDSDEAVHAIEGLQPAASLRNGRIGDMVQQLYFHRWYPPLLSLYLMPFLAILGPVYWAARFPLLLLFLVNLALLYRVGRLISGRAVGGMAVASLGATSPVLLVHALLCMEEMPAMTGLLLVVAAYVLWTRGKLGPRWTGIALAVTFVARISLGVFTAVALVTAYGMGRGRPGDKVRTVAQLIGPLAITALVWWAHPYKWQGLTDYFQASAPGQPSFTWSLVVHHWLQLLSMHTPGLLVGILVVVSVLMSIRWWRKPPVRFLLVLLLVVWSALVLKRQLAPRLFLPALVPAFLLTGLQVGALAEKSARTAARFPPWTRQVLIGGLGLYLVAVIGVRALTFPFVVEVVLESDPHSEEARAWIAQHVSADRVLLINPWDHFSAPGLSWYLAQRRWPGWEPGQVYGVELRDPSEQPEAVADFQKAAMDAQGATIVHLGNVPVAEAGAWWAYQASLVACWDGEWEATKAFRVRVWDGRMEEEVLAHPLRFLREQDRKGARQALWYLLNWEVNIAICG
jgi:hypothetical protein